MPETFRKLNCKLCESAFYRTNLILKFMEVQRFHCKICETNFAKGHFMKGHIISVHVETNNFIWIMWNWICNILLDENSWVGKDFIANCVKLLLQQLILNTTWAHDRRIANLVCNGLYFRAIYRFFTVTHVRIDLLQNQSTLF